MGHFGRTTLMIMIKQIQTLINTAQTEYLEGPKS